MAKLSVWLKGLAAAIVGGAVAGIAQTAASGHINTQQAKAAAIAGAGLTAAAYLTQSPRTPAQ
jgi:hypothetical protein